MPVNRNQQPLGKITTTQRARLAKEYYRIFRTSLFTTVAKATGYDRTTVFNTWKGKYASANPKIEAALWQEVARLICVEGEIGDCKECPLRKVCERMAKE